MQDQTKVAEVGSELRSLPLPSFPLIKAAFSGPFGLALGPVDPFCLQSPMETHPAFGSLCALSL